MRFLQREEFSECSNQLAEEERMNMTLRFLIQVMAVPTQGQERYNVKQTNGGEE